MVATRTIVPRPRAGFPAGWATAGKTGAGNGHTNDIALVGRPDGAPLLVSAFYAAPRLEGPAR